MGCGGSKQDGVVTLQGVDTLEGTLETRVALSTNAGALETPGLFTANSVKRFNHDAGGVWPKLGGQPLQVLFGVCDGNGDHGQYVSDQASKLVSAGVIERCTGPLTAEACTEALKASFEAASTTLRGDKKASKSGTTVLMAIAAGDVLAIASVGDSLAVLGKSPGPQTDAWEATALNKAHKPGDDEEKIRITAAGGYVLVDEDELFGDAGRVYDLPEPFFNKDLAVAMASNPGDVGGVALAPSTPAPGLNVSRLLGHKTAYDIGVSDTPDIKTFSLTPEDKVIILATDGLWDMLEPQKAVEICKEHSPDGDAAATALMGAAKKKWTDVKGYSDDITVVVIFLPLDGPVPNKEATAIKKGGWRGMFSTMLGKKKSPPVPTKSWGAFLEGGNFLEAGDSEYTAGRMPSEEVLKSAFSKVDTDNSGSIDKAELAELLKSTGENPSPEEVDKMFTEADTDKNGSIDFAEFLAVVGIAASAFAQEAAGAAVTELPSEESLKALFEEFDGDKNGTIDQEELKQILVKLGDAPSDEKVAFMFKEADEDGNGTIEFAEFLAIAKKAFASSNYNRKKSVMPVTNSDDSMAEALRRMSWTISPY